MSSPSTSASSPKKKFDFINDNTNKIILGHYKLLPENFLGNGSFSVVYECQDLLTGEICAIKTYIEDKVFAQQKRRYKNTLSDEEIQEIALNLTERKFVTQVEILEQLLSPFNDNVLASTLSPDVVQSDIDLMRNLTTAISPKDVFLRMIDYSHTIDKETNIKYPSADPCDGKFYIIFEKGDFTLNDYIKDRNYDEHPLCLEELQGVMKGLFSILACLHQKGLVHLDLKPDNIMNVDGKWKLIDVDGMVVTSTEIRSRGGRLSFTPLYCAPELAYQLISGYETLLVTRRMDVWGLGMTCLDLLFTRPVLTSIYEIQGSDRKFLSWLSDGDIRITIPDDIKQVNEDLYDLLQNCMLDKDPSARWSSAMCLQHPFLTKSFNINEETTSPKQPSTNGEDFQSLSQFQEAIAKQELLDKQNKNNNSILNVTQRIFKRKGKKKLKNDDSVIINHTISKHVEGVLANSIRREEMFRDYVNETGLVLPREIYKNTGLRTIEVEVDEYEPAEHSHEDNTNNEDLNESSKEDQPVWHKRVAVEVVQNVKNKKDTGYVFSRNGRNEVVGNVTSSVKDRARRNSHHHNDIIGIERQDGSSSVCLLI